MSRNVIKGIQYLHFLSPRIKPILPATRITTTKLGQKYVILSRHYSYLNRLSDANVSQPPSTDKIQKKIITSNKLHSFEIKGVPLKSLMTRLEEDLEVELMTRLEEDLEVELQENTSFYGNLIAKKDKFFKTLHHALKNDEHDDTSSNQPSGCISNQHQSTISFLRQLEKYQRQGDFGCALKVLEEKFLFEASCKPSVFVFSTVMAALSSESYSKKVFGLFEVMKKKNIQPVSHTYTALFQAAHWCNNIRYGNLMTENIVKYLDKEDFQPTSPTMNALIRALAGGMSAGNLLEFVKDILVKVKLDSNTMQRVMVLVGRKQWNVLYYTLIIWHLMEDMQIPFTVNHYNTLLHAVHKYKLKNLNEFISMVTYYRPSVMKGMLSVDERQWYGMMSPARLNTPEGRFHLLGGPDGYLKHMEENGVVPDGKLFTHLLDLIAPNAEEERKLMNFADEHDVQLDVVFYSKLMARKRQRKEYIGLRKVFAEMIKKGVEPSIISLNEKAKLCFTIDSGLLLLRDIKARNLTPNIYTYIILFTRSNKDFHYKMLVMRSMIENNVAANETFLSIVESHLEKAKKSKTAMEFCAYYDEWIEKVEIMEPPFNVKQYYSEGFTDNPWTSLKIKKMR